LPSPSCLITLFGRPYVSTPVATVVTSVIIFDPTMSRKISDEPKVRDHGQDLENK